MATITGLITVNDKLILEVDANPASGLGTEAPLGSIALYSDGTTATLYIKDGTNDTNWSSISAITSEDIQDAIANALTASANITFSYNDPLNQISADLTNTGVTAGTYGSASSIPSIVVDSKGRITSASNTAIAITSSQITDFDEAAQDAIGNALQDTATIDFTYNDASNQISASVIQSALDHGSIGGLGDDDHAQYALLAGRAGGQSLNGGTAASDNLSLSSTTNATKGKINLGANSAFDEANTRLGIGTNNPETILHIEQNSVKYNISASSTTTSGAVNAVVASVATTTNSVELLKVFVTGLRTNGSNESVAYERTVRIKNNAGTVSVLSVQSDYTSEDGSLGAANIAFVVSGTSVNVQVTGVASANITWKAVLHRMR
jgi:hypothetical protein